MNKEIYTLLDLDGVILDSEQRMLELREKNQHLGWNEFFETLDWPKLLHESKEINYAIEILKELQSRDEKIAILTKVHTLLEAQAKVNELRQNRGITFPIYFVPPHIKKSQIYYPSKGEILVDDSIKNVSDWNLEGGTGILFKEEETNKKGVVKSLKFLLK